MQTLKTYLNDTYCYTHNGKIIHTDCDERGQFVILDQTIFYPQGGGQPSDQGYMDADGTRFEISHVRTVNDQIRHYTTLDCTEHIGKEVKLKINPEKRLCHAKLHTSGHLISNIVESLYPTYHAIKGHHFPGECYVEFSLMSESPQAIDLNTLNGLVQHQIENNLTMEYIEIEGKDLPHYCPHLPYTLPKTESIRLIKIGPFGFQPCGGTHVKTSAELKGLSLTKQKLKGTSLKIYYQII